MAEHSGISEHQMSTMMETRMLISTKGRYGLLQVYQIQWGRANLSCAATFVWPDSTLKHRLLPQIAAIE